MKDFTDFLKYMQEPENASLLLERVSRGFPEGLTFEDAEELKKVQKMAASATLAYLQAYHEWLSQNQE